MKQFRLFLVLMAALFMAITSCQEAPLLTLTGARTYNFTRDGGTQSFTFSCNQDWSVSASENWITVSPSSGTSADGEIKVTITCSANTTYEGRSATVTVRAAELSETVTVTQDTGIGLLVSPSSFDLTNAAQDIEIELQKNIQYSIAIDEAGIDWIKVGGTKALSTDIITFHIAENKDYDEREGKITFKQIDGSLTATVVVRQSLGNGLFITTPTYDLSNEAHTLSVEVKANVEFEVSSQADWIKYVETKGLKSSIITLSVDANESYDNRTGTVLVKQTNGDLEGTITINQNQTEGLFVTPDSFELTNQEQTIELTVKQNVAYSVVIPDNAKTWVAVEGINTTKALIEETVVLSIAQNTTYDDRETSITVKQNDGPLAETVRIKQTYGEGLIVETKTYEIDCEGGSVEVDVMANVEFEVESDATWVHYVQTKALTKSTIELSVDKNVGDTTREATVNIKQKNGDLYVAVKIIQGAGEESQETGPFFSKGVELMCLIWKLAGAYEYNQCEVTEVNNSVDEYFSTMINHEAVLLARDYYAQNICYDAVTSYGLHLVVNTNGTISFNPNYLEYDADGFFFRWSPQQRERMLKAVNDFYKKSRFEEWFNTLKPLFNEAKKAFEKVCNVDYTWYDSFFGTIKNPSHQIILSFLIGPNNNGLSVLLKDGSIMSSPVMGSVLVKPSGELYYGGGMLEVIIHEFCHPYCNPLINAHWNSMEKKANEVYQVVQSEMVSQAYGSPVTMMCETFVRSSVIRYFLSHFNDYSRNDLVKQQEALGFKLVGTFVDALELREKNQSTYPTMEDFMPELIQAMNDYVVETYSGSYPEYNNPSSTNLLPGVFTVGPNSQVQFTKSNVFWNGTELRFEDNPMNYPTVWDPSHIGHFYWTTTLEASIAEAYNFEDGQTVSDHLFCDGSDTNHTLSVEGISGLRVLADGKDGEIDYLLKKRKDANKLYKFPVTINGVGTCLVLAPDGFTGTISDSYDAASWAIAEGNGLVCLAPDGFRQNTVILQHNGYKGLYWCGGAKDDSPYHAYHLSFSDNIYYYPSYSSRNNGFSLRLVKDVK